jgi:D-sedoheptulose 7-phosphate isomerase
MSLQETWVNALSEARDILDDFISNPDLIESCGMFSQMLISTYKAGGNVFACGNGGSHCDAMHFAEELTGRFRSDRPALGALALGDPSHSTCVANDYGFNYIFSRQLSGLGRSGDLLIGLSTSGNSENVMEAFLTARHKGIKTVALLGNDGGRLRALADLAIVIPKARTSDRIQEMHIKLIHTVIETVERELYPENY